MAHYALTARIREQKGKEAAKKIRKDNKVPAIFYGPNTDSMMLTVEHSDLRRILKKTVGESIILQLQIESDKGTDTRMVILKELITDPIKNIYLHADFHEISMDRELTVEVPIRLLNTPTGVTDGGILQHVRREITISCLPEKLVDFIEMDVANLDIGESLHIRDIELPEGITSAEDGNLTVAVVMAPTVSAMEEAEEIEEEEEKEVEEAGIESDVKTES